MKILLAIKFYYPRGGDCIYTINLENLLKQHGHEVAIFAMQYPENLSSEWSKYFPSEVNFSLGTGMIESFLRPFGTNEVKRKFTALIHDFQPDVVHLNNIHSQLSPVIAEIAHKKGIKVVWTLHDYKLLCPRYDCQLNGKEACELCFTNKKSVLKHKCMKNSLIGSIIAYQEALKWSKNKLEKYTDAFICPSRFMANKMISGRFDEKKIHVLSNFIDVKKTKRDNYSKDDYYCYAGRLSNEKGIETLIQAAKQLPHKLIVAGSGPLKEKLETETLHSSIDFIGHRQWDEIKEIVGKTKFMVIPSEWYENNPLSAIESLCLGTPVLGSNIGGIPELINQQKITSQERNILNGMLFESRNSEDLKEKIEMMFRTEFDYETIAEDAQKRYSAENYYKEIMKIYN